MHPIAALQTEYSLWTRNAEIAVLQACRDIGAAFVAFSPTARALSERRRLRDVSLLEAKDLRRGMPRFQPDNYAANLQLLRGLCRRCRSDAGCSMVQLALAWLLAQGEHIVPIPGTTDIAHLEENVAAGAVALSSDAVRRAGELINQNTVVGARYNAAAQADVDTENF